MGKKVLPAYDSHNNFHGWIMQCPGCGHSHVYDKRWEYNGNPEKPTFNPSYLSKQPRENFVCHSFVKDGKIQYLNDCTHKYKGKTIEIPDWEEINE
jgi:hypothetical protein